MSSNFTQTLTNVSLSIQRQFTNTTEDGYQKDEISNDESNFTNSMTLIKWSTMTFFVVIFWLGIVGNVMVVLVILKTKGMRNSMNIFLLNLSIADLLVLLVRTPVELVEMNSYSDTWVLGKGMCYTERFLRMLVTHASVFTILAVSLERYYVICKPLKAGSVCTNTRAVVICASIWFFAALITSPILGIITYNDKKDGNNVVVCTTNIDLFWVKMFYVLSITVIYFIPLGIFIVLYSIMVKNLREKSEFKAQNSNNSQNYSNVLKYRKQVTLMLGAVVFAFFVCLLPSETLVLLLIVNPRGTIMLLGEDGFYIYLFIAKIMLFLNSAINPILYNLVSSKFRKGFASLLIKNKLRCC